MPRGVGDSATFFFPPKYEGKSPPSRPTGLASPTDSKGGVVASAPESRKPVEPRVERPYIRAFALPELAEIRGDLLRVQELVRVAYSDQVPLWIKGERTSYVSLDAAAMLRVKAWPSESLLALAQECEEGEEGEQGHIYSISLGTLALLPEAEVANAAIQLQSDDGRWTPIPGSGEAIDPTVRPSVPTIAKQKPASASLLSRG